MNRLAVIAAVFTAFSLTGSIVLADDQKQPQAQSQQKPEKKQERKQDREPIYGSQLMTPQERADFRAKMRAAKTDEERDQLRKEHHAQMQQRAKERGVTLPDEPPARRGRMHRGGGMGPGSGMGGGMGGGMGPRNP